MRALLQNLALWPIAIAVLVAPRLARAGEGRLEIDYAAPSECHGEDVLRERVLSLVHTDITEWNVSARLVLRIARTDGAYVATLTIAQGEERAPASSRSLAGVTCNAVFEAIAVSAALAIDEAFEEPPPVKPRVSAPPPPPPPTRAAAPPRPGASDVRLGSEIGLRGGIAPRPMVVHTAWISGGALRKAWPPVARADVSFGFAPIERTPYGSYRLRALDVGLSLCTPRHRPLFEVVGACAGAAGGVLASSSFDVGFGEPTEHNRPWFAMFVAPRIALPLWHVVHFVVEGRVLVPLFRDTFYFHPNRAVHKAEPWAWQLSLGLELTLPVAAR